MTERGEIRQAVILAGGLGTRLGALTRAVPKPMIELHGKPFLEHLVDQFRAQGLSRIVLLVGHLHDVIRDHFGGGSDFGVSIDYSHLPADQETGARLRHAAPLLDDVFALNYCDNILPVSWSDNARAFAEHDAPVQLTAYRNRDDYTRSNLRVDDDVVTVYDPKREAPGLEGVDVGYMVVDKSVLASIPADNCSFQRATFPLLVEQRRLRARVTEHRYYSIGSPERLPETERFLARTPTVLLDRDGVLNERMPRARYVTSWDDWRWRPGALDALRRLKERGIRTVLITNQPGIARGHLSLADLDEIHRRMRHDARAAGGDIDVIYQCTHGWNDGCDCRKPAPGMLLRAQKDLALDLLATPFVGDDDRDAQAAMAAGCRFHRLGLDDSLIDMVDRLVSR